MTRLLDELRALAPVQSPTDRISGSEVADLLGALVAYAEHGGSIFDAAHEGPQAVADHSHDVAARQAEEAGTDAPVKGAPVAPGPVTSGAPTPAGGVLKADFDKLVGLVETLLSRDAAPNATASETGGGPGAGDSEPSPSPATDPPPLLGATSTAAPQTEAPPGPPADSDTGL